MKSYDDMEREALQLRHDVFRGLSEQQMEKLMEWFIVEFGINQGAFRVVNGEWNALDAARQDAFRVVWLSMQKAWEEVNLN